MKVKLHNNNDVTIPEMKDGEIGVITQWYGTARYDGQIVQMYRGSKLCNKDILIVIGGTAGDCWTLFDGVGADCRVRILPPGTLLEIME